MAFEISVSTFCVIGVGGIVAFIIGSIMLYDTSDPNFRVALSLIASMTIITGAFILFAATLMISAHNKPVVTGEEGLLGKEGIVISIHEDYILIRVLGELWKAQLIGITEPGHSVKIVKVDGLLLTVKPVDKEFIIMSIFLAVSAFVAFILLFNCVMCYENMNVPLFSH